MIKIANKEVAEQIAEHLLEIKAIKLSPSSPFTWASGWKSPIYCDNRLSLSYPSVRTYIKKELINIIKANHADVQGISGVATAGVSQGALIADALELPYSYVRSSAKKHGMTNKIEGVVTEGQKVIMIEDLVSTGGSSIDAALAVREVGAEVQAIAAIFTYGFPVITTNLEKVGIPLLCLCDYETLIQVAIEKKYISSDQFESLSKWQQAPDQWSA